MLTKGSKATRQKNILVVLHSGVLVVILALGVLFSLLYASQSLLEEYKNHCWSTFRIERSLSFDFRTPSYLPDGYQYACGKADLAEGIVAYWNKQIIWEELKRDDVGFAESHQGAIVIYVSREYGIKNDTAAVLGEYHTTIELAPQHNPQLVQLNGNHLAWTGSRTVVFDGLDGSKTEGVLVWLRTYYDEQSSLLLQGEVPMETLLKVAESLEKPYHN